MEGTLLGGLVAALLAKIQDVVVVVVACLLVPVPVVALVGVGTVIVALVVAVVLTDPGMAAMEAAILQHTDTALSAQHSASFLPLGSAHLNLV